jgi:hypothetical protein
MSTPSVVPLSKTAAPETAGPPSVPGSAHAPAQRPHGAFLPLLLLGLTVLAMLGGQTWLLASERDTLQTAHASQQQTVDNAGKLRASLDTLAADTQRLADAGNASAALLVAELKKRGVTINPQAAAAAPAAPR